MKKRLGQLAVAVRLLPPCTAREKLLGAARVTRDLHWPAKVQAEHVANRILRDAGLPRSCRLLVTWARV